MPNSSFTGVVEPMENDGFLAVVNTHDGGEAWLPVVELVRVVADEIVTLADLLFLPRVEIGGGSR